MKRFAICFVLYVLVRSAADEMHEIVLQYVIKKVENWELTLPQRSQVIVLENNLAQLKRQYICLLDKETQLEPQIFWLCKILRHTELTAEDRRCYQREFKYIYSRFVQLAIAEDDFTAHIKDIQMKRFLCSLGDAQTMAIVGIHKKEHPDFQDAMAGNVDAIYTVCKTFDQYTPPIVRMYWLYRIYNLNVSVKLKRDTSKLLKDTYRSIYDYAHWFVSKSKPKKRAKLRKFLQQWQSITRLQTDELS